MKKYCLYLIVFFICTKVNAQQIITSSGFTNEKDFSAEWIIGGSLFDNSILEANDENIPISDTLYCADIIDLYPTATKDYINIIRKDNPISILEYKINNSSGKVILKGNLSTRNPLELDVTALSSGLYTIIFNHLADNTIIVTKKFIKL